MYYVKPKMLYPLPSFFRNDYTKLYKKLTEYLQVVSITDSGISYTPKLHIICKINSRIHSTSMSDAGNTLIHLRLSINFSIIITAKLCHSKYSRVRLEKKPKRGTCPCALRIFRTNVNNTLINLPNFCEQLATK